MVIFLSKNLRLLHLFNFNFTVFLDYFLFLIEMLEKQETVVPHLLQKCNNKLPQTKIFFTVTLFTHKDTCIHIYIF